MADDAHKNCLQLEIQRASLDYDIDGAVVKVNELSMRPIMGATRKHPKWAIAYKFSGEIKTTRLRDIIMQVAYTVTLPCTNAGCW
jgi:DNA ligase (NAD+)